MTKSDLLVALLPPEVLAAAMSALAELPLEERAKKLSDFVNVFASNLDDDAVGQGNTKGEKYT